MNNKSNLALFDFDGTITSKDTYTEFIKYAVSPRKFAIGFVTLLPYIIGYKLGWVSGPDIRPKLSWFAFKDVDTASLNELGERYAREIIPTFLRPNAIERIRWHKQQGDEIAIVSASLDTYLRHWCDLQGFDLICTQLEIKDGICTGRYVNGDCTGAEKARRVGENYKLSDFEKVYCYGDSSEDDELLSLGTERFFRWKGQ